MDFFSLFASKAQQLFWRGIDASRISGGARPELIPANQAYFVVRLTELYTATARKLWKDLCPAVHTSVQTGKQEQHTIAGPAQISALSDSNPDRISNLNHLVAGPLPFLGNDVQLVVGLYSVPGKDTAQILIDAVASLGMYLPGEVDAAIPMASIAKSAIEKLLGLDQAALHFGVCDTFSAVCKPLTTGYYVGIGAPENSVNVAQLWIADGRLLQGNDLASAKPYEQHDYLVLRIERMDTRLDWADLPELAATLAELSEIAGDTQFTTDEKRARLAPVWPEFIEALAASPNLTPSDADSIAQQKTTELLKRLDAEETTNPFLKKVA